MRRTVFSILALVALLLPTTADAGALLRLTPPGVAAAGYTGPTDPVPLPSSGFRLTYHSQGNSNPVINPVLLILGIPGATSAPAISYANASSGFAGVTAAVGGGPYYGGAWNASTGFAGTYDATSAGGGVDVYQFIGLNSPGGSQNYPNWSTQSGFSSFNLFVYSLTFTNPLLSPGTWAEFSSLLPVGTYVIGYGCETTAPQGNKPAAAPCSSNGITQGTPFTFAGLVTEVPEPGTLSLLIPAAAAYFMRRRRNK